MFDLTRGIRFKKNLCGVEPEMKSRVPTLWGFETLSPQSSLQNSSVK